MLFWGALYVGVLYCANNFLLMYHMGGQGHVIQIGWIPLCFLVVDRLLRNQRIGDALTLGVLLTLLLLGSAQYLVFMSTLLPAYMLLQPPRVVWNRRCLLLLGATCGVFLVASAPYLMDLLSTPPTLFSTATIRRLGFSLDNIMQFVRPSNRACLGLVPVCLAVASVSTWRAREPWLLPTLVLVVLCPILMMGPFAAWAPYQVLHDYWPGFQHIRTPMRVYAFQMTFVMLLAATSVAQLRRLVPDRWRTVMLGLLFLLTAATQLLPSSVLARGRVQPSSAQTGGLTYPMAPSSGTDLP